MKKFDAAVVGLGYVGLPLFLRINEKRINVIGIERDNNKISTLSMGKSPIKDKGLEKKLKSSKLHVTNDFGKIKTCKFVVICVPTPIDHNYLPDLKPVISAVTEVAKNISRGTVVILESTVNPGICDEIVTPLLERHSGMKINKDFYLAHCPERINPGDDKWNVTNINRVIGASSEAGLNLAESFYKSFLKVKFKLMNSLKEAEAVKIVENTFRDINIAFVNELAMSFSELGIDVKNVIDGASTKPFAFMAHYPGCGVGGHCIPVDPYYLIEYAKGKGFNHDFLTLARRINNNMPSYSVELLTKSLNSISMPVRGTRVGLLGYAYKGNIEDARESPAKTIKKLLEKLGAVVEVYDPFLPQLSTCDSLKSTLKKCDAIFIATAHYEFKKISASLLRNSSVKVILDGRNILNPKEIEDAGIIYRGIGR